MDDLTRAERQAERQIAQLVKIHEIVEGIQGDQLNLARRQSDEVEHTNRYLKEIRTLVVSAGWGIYICAALLGWQIFSK